jgi:hypothetical protein
VADRRLIMGYSLLRERPPSGEAPRPVSGWYLPLLSAPPLLWNLLQYSDEVVQLTWC